MTGLDGRGMPLVLQAQLLAQRPVGVLPAIGGQRRSRRLGQPCQRPDPRVPPQPLAARDIRGRGVRNLFRPELEKPDIHLLAEGDIQPVQPGHRRVAVIVMAVKTPTRRQQQVAPAHPHRIAIDHRPDAFALDDKAKRVLRMAVLGRRLARAEILYRRPHGRADIGVPSQPRIGEPDGPALSPPPDRDQIAGALCQWQQGRPFPDVRNRFGLGMHRHQVTRLRPKRVQVIVREGLVERFQFGCVLGLHGVGAVVVFAHLLSCCSGGRQRLAVDLPGPGFR